MFMKMVCVSPDNNIIVFCPDNIILGPNCLLVITQDSRQEFDLNWSKF